MTRSTPTIEQLTSYRDTLWTREYGGAATFSLEHARRLWDADQDRSEALVATRVRQAEARRQRQAVRDAQRDVGEDLAPETFEEAFLRSTVEGLPGLRARFLTEPLAVHRQSAWEAIESSISTIVSAETWDGVENIQVKDDTITVHLADGTRVEAIVPENVKTWGDLPDVTLHMAVWNVLMGINSESKVAA
ncbi:hypothetical protein [Sanguibacter sp. Leaf3]|uniref:hypothetical protein n=1 Tax=Sanguibacter sp. Leaf3 TaxID=1736209 RepID=UPI0006FE1142|nr:hypothetical protein [Sanguibacter sp. Leaf3]KQT98374.1 hypothetical protein ASG53_11985 [Sanguibacter sp. Leaf3]